MGFFLMSTETRHVVAMWDLDKSLSLLGLPDMIKRLAFPVDTDGNSFSRLAQVCISEGQPSPVMLGEWNGYRRWHHIDRSWPTYRLLHTGLALQVSLLHTGQVKLSQLRSAPHIVDT